jgi:hypothetical protein
MADWKKDLVGHEHEELAMKCVVKLTELCGKPEEDRLSFKFQR